MLEKHDPSLVSVRIIVTKLGDALQDPDFCRDVLQEFDLDVEAKNLEAAQQILSLLSTAGLAASVPEVIAKSKHALLMIFCESGDVTA